MAADLTRLDPSLARHFGWTEDPGVAAVAAALEAAAPGGARFVGGCVRDSLVGVAPKDIDLATTLPPQAASEALAAAGLGVAPTGLDHGTVTAIAVVGGAKSVVEVTTLRADVATDGRRAVVAFTDDWAVDARRRDFTINALYLTPALELFDPVGGTADLAAGRVRFIGDPENRIREDYLRVLRFFRFSARFAAGAFDPAGLAACRNLKDGLKRLSAERVGQETAAILALETPSLALAAMRETGVLEAIWPAPADLDALVRLKQSAPDAPPALGLAALWGAAGAGLGKALRLSKADDARRAAAAANAPKAAGVVDNASARILHYRLGAERFRDAALIAGRSDLVDYADQNAPPVFSLSGKDVVALGVEPGPDVARVLAVAEARWIDEGFPDRRRAQALLAAAVAAEGG